MPPLRIWIRNLGIGAILVSFKAILALIAQPSDRDARLAVVVLSGAGAVAGLGFTALTPVRMASKVGHYVTWVLAVYFMLAALIVASWLQGDQTFTYSLTLPVGWVFWLGSGLAMGIFCARVADRWSKGDFR